MEQRNLFDEKPTSSTGDAPESMVSGLRYVRDFISQVQHDQLLSQIDLNSWLSDLKRRVQHYGYKYDYKSRNVDPSMRIGPLPVWAEQVAEQLYNRGFVAVLPDQVIVNEYMPGQGIANHIDCVPCFADTIMSLSLGSACVMELTNRTTQQVVPLLLEPKSLVVLQADARFVWTHGIPARKTDRFEGRVIQRRRRVSLTFRKVILDAAPHI